MRVSLAFQIVQSGGNEIAEPTYWPAYFAVDDAALRSLSGDIVSDWLVAPGALAKDEMPAAVREVAERGLGGGGWIGFGLMYTDGGADSEAAQAGYQELIATLHTLALGHVASATGLDVLLGAFGGGAAFDAKPGELTLERLREGVDPADVGKEIDGELLTGVAAFRAAGEAVLPFTQGVPGPVVVAPPPKKTVGDLTHVAAAHVAGTPATAALAAAARIARPAVRAVPSVAGPIARGPLGATRGTTVGPVVRPPIRRAFAAGTVLAVTAQAFRIDDLGDKGQIAFERTLPPRINLKTSLRLTGSVSREG